MAQPIHGAPPQGQYRLRTGTVFRWANLDLDPGSRADIVWNVTDGLPFPDGSCAFIYSEHFLEHLPIQDGVRFLKECHRSLQKGGVLRVAMPSLQEVVRQYYENDWAKEALA
jgi:predicted SAM-dependent methyltransferase